MAEEGLGAAMVAFLSGFMMLSESLGGLYGVPAGEVSANKYGTSEIAAGWRECLRVVGEWIMWVRRSNCGVVGLCRKAGYKILKLSIWVAA